MPADLTTLSNILKDLYLGPVQEQLQNDVLIVQRLGSSSQELVGNQAVIPLHTSRTGGIGARPEAGALPTDGNQSYRKITYDLKYLYGAIKVSGIAMLKTRSDAGAFLRALQSEIDGLKADLTKDVARQLYGDGTGAVATLTSGSTTTVLNLASNEALLKGQIYPNMVINVGTLANPVSRSSTPGTVASVDPNGNGGLGTVTLAAAISGAGAAGEFIFRYNNTAAASVSYEMNGLKNVVSTSTGTSLGNLSATTEPLWDNVRVNNGSGSIVLDNIEQALGRVRINGGKPSVAITSYGIRRQIFNQLSPQVRYAEPQSLKGGFTALQYGDYPVVVDVDAPYGALYLLDEAQLRLFSPEDWGWLQEDGKVLKWDPGYDRWIGVMRRAMQLGAVRRNTHAVIYGMTDAGY